MGNSRGEIGSNPGPPRGTNWVARRGLRRSRPRQLTSVSPAAERAAACGGAPVGGPRRSADGRPSGPDVGGPLSILRASSLLCGGWPVPPHTYRKIVTVRHRPLLAAIRCRRLRCMLDWGVCPAGRARRPSLFKPTRKRGRQSTVTAAAARPFLTQHTLHIRRETKHEGERGGWRRAKSCRWKCLLEDGAVAIAGPPSTRVLGCGGGLLGWPAPRTKTQQWVLSSGKPNARGPWRARSGVGGCVSPPLPPPPAQVHAVGQCSVAPPRRMQREVGAGGQRRLLVDCKRMSGGAGHTRAPAPPRRGAHHPPLGPCRT